jgi:hypothetical protein
MNDDNKNNQPAPAAPAANTAPAPLGEVISTNEGVVKDHLDKLVIKTVEETLNGLLDAEAGQLCGARRYEHNPDRLDTRAGHYERQLHTKAGEVTVSGRSKCTRAVGSKCTTVEGLIAHSAARAALRRERPPSEPSTINTSPSRPR